MSSISLTLSRPRLGLRRFVRHLGQVVLRLELAMQVHRERRMLSGLDDRTLKDVGFQRGQARIEAERSFWDLPVDRLRR